MDPREKRLPSESAYVRFETEGHPGDEGRGTNIDRHTDHRAPRARSKREVANTKRRYRQRQIVERSLSFSAFYLVFHTAEARALAWA